MVLPVIAIVGRPNVGKSTLFNRLLKCRDALVVDRPGVTRDRIYGEGECAGQRYILVDTGGLSGDEQGIDHPMAEQTLQAIEESDGVFFLVDGRAGLTSGDEAIAQHLRRQSKTVYLIVNKTDGLEPNVALAEFYALGFSEPVAISASHGRNVNRLLTDFFASRQTPEPEQESVLVEAEEEIEETQETQETQESSRPAIKVAIIGRPNVGKSTLVNRLLGEERVVVFDQPGTTRDSIEVPFTRDDKPYVLVDTAGVRKRGRVKDIVEKFSVIKTLQAIEQAHVVIFLVDAQTGVVEHDKHLLHFVLESGRSLVIAINKWDGLDDAVRKNVRISIERHLGFVSFAKLRFISALHGTGVGNLWGLVQQAYRSATQKLSTARLTRILEEACEAHPPPLANGRRIKLRYAHAGGRNPPVIVVHGKQVEALSDTYRRYLMNFFIKKLRLVGTPINIQFQQDDNPYAERKNRLTEGQYRRRRAMIKREREKRKKQ